LLRQILNDLAIVSVAVTMTAHANSDVHMRGAFCSVSVSENPLSDLRLVTTLAAMRGNLERSAFCWLSDHCVTSSTSHVQSFVRVHRPPNLSILHSACMYVEMLSGVITQGGADHLYVRGCFRAMV
jgi:hypothetical protein